MFDYSLSDVTCFDAVETDFDVCERMGERDRKSGRPSPRECIYGFNFVVPGDEKEHRKVHDAHERFFATHGWSPCDNYPEFRWAALAATKEDSQKYKPLAAIFLAASNYYQQRHVRRQLGRGAVEPFLLHMRNNWRWRQVVDTRWFTQPEEKIRHVEQLLERAKVAKQDREMIAPPIRWHEAELLVARLEALPPVKYPVPAGPRRAPAERR